MTPTNLMNLLQQQAECYGDKVAFSYTPDGTVEQARISYRQLDARARVIAADLQQRGATGQRVLLVCEPGLNTAVGYFGCVYAGAIAVPMGEPMSGLKHVAADVCADFALATTAMQARVRRPIDAATTDQPLQWCTIDRRPSGYTAEWVAPQVDADDIALIQYTSGSADSAKGVLISHRNLLHNMAAIRGRCNGDDADVAVWCLPQQQGMGLIGGILAMVHLGCTTYLLAPRVLKKPIRWLEMVSRHRATITGAPTFAYDRCVERTTEAQRAVLDLSGLTHAWIGAEPVHVGTLQAFADAFAPAGFRLDGFQTCYGLAESTLLVSAMPSAQIAGARYIDRNELARAQVRDVTAGHPDAVAVVGCGPVLDGLRVLIVDPETRIECGDDELGEIWVAGPSIAAGYWGRPAETARTFAATLADTGEGPFLRTGDLGFVCAGELFITGRRQNPHIADNVLSPNEIKDPDAPRSKLRSFIGTMNAARQQQRAQRD